MSERKMATIRRIDAINPIENADAIEVATVGGWKVVCQKGLYKAGDLVVYCEIDSWIPTEVAPFLSKGQEPHEYNGVKGERLRTVRLRGVTSQGLLLPVEVILEYQKHIPIHSPFIENFDVSEILGIQKYEPPIPACLAGEVKGAFPSWGRKTDQERCQNLESEIQEAYDNDVKFEVTIKLDGSSCSCGTSVDGEYVVCSRNLSLHTDQEGNTFVDVCNKKEMDHKTANHKGLLFSGELIGPGIQKNREGLKEHDVFVFDIYDSVNGKYLSSNERINLCKQLTLSHVPVLYNGVTLRELNLHNVSDILKFAEGSSLHNKNREGLVFKSIDGSFSFKSISNKFLVKNEE